MALAAGIVDGDQLPRDGVADQQPVTVEPDTLWLVEAAELVADAPFEVADEDAVVPCVRDRDQASAIRGDLPWEGKRVIRPGSHGRERRPDREIRSAVEKLLDHVAERRSVALAGRHGDNVAVRVDHDQCRPGANAVLLPR